ncbi:MAG: hypothetical protein MZV63_44095 [Marinilabiliales bacterium]|nr:hypothetical protein [Marinilabiliales bacterium]
MNRVRTTSHVTNSGGCTSPVSADVIINTQPGPFPTLVITNPCPCMFSGHS